jgi:Putative porin
MNRPFHGVAALPFAAASFLALGTFGAVGQSADALLDKLVEKGVLTLDEANDLRTQSDEGFTKATQIKNGMPDWVQSFKINGDFRGRVENFQSANPLWTSRTRYRYRARLQFDVSMMNEVEVVIRLAGADLASTGSLGGSPPGFLGGNPLSANTTFNGNGARKFAFFDAAYAKWTPLHNGDWTGAILVGKLDNPFQVSNMVFDYDYVPEGVAFQLQRQLSEHHSIKAIGGAYVVGEINQQAGQLGLLSPSHDPAIFGAQVIWDAAWTPKWSTQLGLGVFDLSGRENLGAFSGDPNNLIFVNDGNTRDASGRLANAYNPVVVDASTTYMLSTFPLYPGAFPVKVFGEYMDNPSAPTENEGYRVGVTLGRADGRGKWEITYRYESLGADAWYDAVVDDDNGAFYQQAIPGSPFDNTGLYNGAGIRGGTNVRGHQVIFNYAFTDYATFTVTYYVNTLINPYPAATKSAAGHLMADLSFRF